MLLSQSRQKEISKDFNRRLPELQKIQTTVINETIPKVAHEIHKLNGEEVNEETVEWLEEWVNDTGQIFRIYKRNDFNVISTIAAIHQNLVWRIRNLSELPESSPSSFLRFLPHPLLNHSPSAGELVSTPPILYISLGELTKFAKHGTKTASERADEVKNVILNTYEAGRMFMKDLNSRIQSPSPGLLSVTKEFGHLEDGAMNGSRIRIVQFVLMVDVQGAGLFRELGSDISSWLGQEVAPNFPGVCNAVYVVNYSWAYSALWGFIKRFLPAKVLGRISFVSTGELLEHFPPECFLEEHGGSLPPLDPDFDSILDRYLRPRSTPSDSTVCPSSSVSSETSGSPPSMPSAPLPTPIPSSSEPIPPSTIINAFSPSNPYYGYPTIVEHHKDSQTGRVTAVPRLLHGRRRKRDLVRALAFLFFLKWKRHTQHYWVLVNNAFRSQMHGVLGVIRPAFATLQVLPSSPGEWAWKLAMLAAVVAAIAMRRTKLIGNPSKLSWVSLIAVPLGAGNFLKESPMS